jgi:uncharacterized protein
MAKSKKTKKPSQALPDLEQLDEEIDRYLEGVVETDAPPAPAPVQTPAPEPTEPGDEPPGENEPEQESGAEASEEATQAQPLPPLEVAISEDGLQATVTTIFPDTTMEQALAFLEEKGISVGVDEPAIQKAISTAKNSKEPVKDVAVANGNPPRLAPPPTVEHLPPDALTSLPALEPTSKLLEAESPKEIMAAAADLEVWNVDAGQILARRVQQGGKPGTDVRGKEIPIPEPEDGSESKALNPGQSVELGPNGSDYVAGTPGCAGVLDGQIAVLAPIWIAPDGMLACFLAAPAVSGSARTGNDAIKAQLMARGVTEGVDDKAIEGLCDRLRTGKYKPGLARIAAGKAPSPPRDAVPEFGFPHAPQVGAIRPDGSVNFKERGLFPPVEKEALLAEMAPAEEGQPGLTVKGEEIPPPPPKLGELLGGDNVRVEESAGVVKVFASEDGGASVQTTEVTGPDGPITRHTVSVRPVAQFAGDINYETGNIDFLGNVDVKGSVTGGFKLKASGAVNISGGVEAGAEVRAKGDLTVGLGIVGDDTQVVSEGALTVKFIQDATVEAAGDVVVGSYIRGARVKSTGSVSVEGKGGSGGGIIGGETWGPRGIKTRNIGSERSTTTFVAVGVDAEAYQAYQKAGQMVRQAEVLVKNLLKALGLKDLDKEEIRKLIGRNPRKKGAIVQYVQKANKVVEMRETQIQERQRLGQKLAEAAKSAALEVQETAFARVRVRIGTEEAVTQQDLKAVRYSLDADGQIAPTELSGG